jgi:hypothetical protein
MNLAARLEELTPASSQRRASFIATSAYGDVLALSQNNVLHYTHSSLRDLRPILVDGNAFKLATLTTIRFNASAEAVLVAGPNILCTAGFLSWTQTLQRKITISSPGLATTTWKGWGAVPQSRMEQLGAYRSSLQC